MENKKKIIGMILIIILIIALIAVTILYNNFSETQLNLLTEESNKLIQQDLINEEIDEEIKTQKDYAVVEKTIKEYLSNIKNIYLEMENLNSKINADEIFSASNKSCLNNAFSFIKPRLIKKFLYTPFNIPL